MKLIFFFFAVNALLFVKAQDDDCFVVNRKECAPSDEPARCETERVCDEATQAAGTEPCGGTVCTYPFVCADPGDEECVDPPPPPPGCGPGEDSFCFTRSVPCGPGNVCTGATRCTFSDICPGEGAGNPQAGTDATTAGVPPGCTREYSCVNDGTLTETDCDGRTCAPDESCNRSPYCAEYQARLQRCLSPSPQCVRLSEDLESNRVPVCNLVEVCKPAGDEGAECGDTVCGPGEICNNIQEEVCDEPPPENPVPLVEQTQPATEVEESDSGTSGLTLGVTPDTVQGSVLSVVRGRAPVSGDLGLSSPDQEIRGSTRATPEEVFQTIPNFNFTGPPPGVGGGRAPDLFTTIASNRDQTAVGSETSGRRRRRRRNRF